MRRTAIGYAIILFLLMGVGANAQNGSTVVSSPGFVPPGVQQVEREAGIEHSLPPTSMAKETALLNIPEGVSIPTIDGIFDPGEWSDALEITPTTVVTAGCKAWFKMDACNLYIAAIVKTPGTYTGNSTMINIWFDLDQDGQWDTAGLLDGNLALPAPGMNYPNDVASFGYASLPGWTTSSTGRLRFHYPWSTMGVVPPQSQIFVKRTVFNSTEMHIEAVIDYQNSPLHLTGNDPINARIQWYAGYYTGGGTVQIQAQWPTINTSAYFSGPTPGELNADVLPPLVIAPPDVFDVVDINVQDNPQFSSKAYYTGGNLTLEVGYVSTAPPTTSACKINIYGPHPSSALFTTINTNVLATQASGTALLSVPVNMPAGFYRVEVIVDDPWVCGIKKIEDISNILVMLPGQIPCTVWPGDVNQDGVANYADRSDLNTYIFDANLSPAWLMGPGRLAPSFPTPLSEYEWTGQAAGPWSTPEGCYMDADGNGVVNNFDYVAIKINWLRSTGSINPKDGKSGTPTNFAMNQNYPNPFNPSTSLLVELPERAQVRIEVRDMLGRKVADLANGDMDAGSHSFEFHANNLASGTYLATAVMTGIESGITFTRSVSMTLSK
ncbi:MAG: T9SS type A sorting domain-containing protein [Bacteroidota bacterium]